MANIYDQLKSLISNEVIAKAATELGDNHEQIAQAAKNVIPTLLGGYLNFGDKKAVQDTLREAQSKNVLTNIGNLFMAYPEKDARLAIGEKLVSSLFGPKESTLHRLVATEELMSNANATKFTAMLATIVAGVVGKHSYKDLLGEQSAILAAIPKEYRDKLGIKEMKGVPTPAPAAIHTPAPAAAVAPQVKNIPHVKDLPTKKRSLAWLWWLIGLILLAILLCLLLRGCNGCSKKAVEVVPLTPVTETVNKAINAVEGKDVSSYDLTLPDGKGVITVHKGLMIDKIITFLKSDEYTKATNEEMKDHWFEFEKLDFAFNSPTEFVESDDETVDRLAFLLKYFPDTKIRIAGKADVKGKKNPNIALSEARANTIKRILESNGIAAGRVSTEGFGEEFAKIPATATDDERAPDRDIAFRFMK